MGLAIGRQVGESVLLIRDHETSRESVTICLQDIVDDEKFVLVRQHDEKAFTITALEATEVMPEVFISAGKKFGSYPGVCKLVISAPQEVQIYRSELLHE